MSAKTWYRKVEPALIQVDRKMGDSILSSRISGCSVIHGSRVDSNDSDNDTLLDMEEVGIGSNPAVSDLHIVEFLSKDMPQKIALAKSEGNATGIIYVQTNPAEFNLYTATELNASNQSAQSAGRNEGQNMVTASPLSYNLIEKNAYDQVAEIFTHQADSL